MPPQLSSQSAGEYVARIRYRTNLDAPQCPPKMVEIGNQANALLLEPSYISNVARTDSICVDVDAELGMPLDMVHLSGVFDGNEASIHSYKTNPPVHPRDRILPRSIGQLGKHSAQGITGAVAASWLRRTEYISAEPPRPIFRGSVPPVTKSEKLRGKNHAIRSAMKIEDADPVRTLAAVLKGFDVANPDTATISRNVSVLDETMNAAEDSWNNLNHPSKSHLHVVETFPLLPDFNATSDADGYLIFKFATDPLITSKTRDTRMDVGLLKPHAENANGDSQPEVAEHSFDFYLPANSNVASKIKRKLTAHGKVDHNPREEFKYNLVRTYETKTHKKHDSTVITEAALIFHPGDNKKPKAAYYYPVVGRYVLQPRRTHKFPPGMPLQEGDLIKEQQRVSQEGVGPPDVLKVTVRDLSQAEKIRRTEHAAASSRL